MVAASARARRRSSADKTGKNDSESAILTGFSAQKGRCFGGEDRDAISFHMRASAGDFERDGRVQEARCGLGRVCSGELETAATAGCSSTTEAGHEGEEGQELQEAACNLTPGRTASAEILSNGEGVKG